MKSRITESSARTAVFFLLAVGVLLASAPRSAAHDPSTLEFRGRVVVPPKAIMRGRRITLSVTRMGTPFNARAWADPGGRFRFRKVLPGTYSVAINIPGAGEILNTVDITPSFADAKRRVEKQFVFDEEALAHDAHPPAPGLVSVRELSIPLRARREYERARGDLRRQNIESAARHFERAVEIAPQYMEALNNLGILSFQRRDYAEAEAYFRQALERDPDAYEPLVNLGGALLALDRAEEAVQVNARAQTARPRDALANAQLGLSHYLAGNDEEALNYLLLTEQLDPAHFSNPQLPLAKIYLRHSEEEAAIEELEDFLVRHPDSPEASSVRETVERIRQSAAPEAAASAF